MSDPNDPPLSGLAGPTGEFPGGRMSERDAGELKIAIAADVANDRVIIDFGVPTLWIGLRLSDVEALIDSLQQAARKLRNPN